MRITTDLNQRLARGLSDMDAISLEMLRRATFEPTFGEDLRALIDVLAAPKRDIGDLGHGF